jgi:hypothetical protein
MYQLFADVCLHACLCCCFQYVRAHAMQVRCLAKVCLNQSVLHQPLARLLARPQPLMLLARQAPLPSRQMHQPLRLPANLRSKEGTPTGPSLNQDEWDFSHDGESDLGALYKSLKLAVMGAGDVDEMTAVRTVVLLRLCLKWLRDCVDGAGSDYLQEVLLMFDDVNDVVPQFAKIKTHFSKGDKEWVNGLKVGGVDVTVSAAIGFLPSDAELLHRLLRILPQLQEYLWRTSGDADVRGKWAKVSESVRNRLTQRQADGMCACIADMLTYC